MAKKFPLQYGKILYELTKDIEGENQLKQTLECYINYLQDKQALHQIEYIIEEYQNLKQEEQGKEKLEITFARNIDDNVIEQLKESFDVRQAEVNQDESIIGGVKIRKGNTVIDGSVKSQLSKLKQNLLK